jgi:hypothetical protein
MSFWQTNIYIIDYYYHILIIYTLGLSFLSVCASFSCCTIRQILKVIVIESNVNCSRLTASICDSTQHIKV